MYFDSRHRQCEDFMKKIFASLLEFWSWRFAEQGSLSGLYADASDIRYSESWKLQLIANAVGLRFLYLLKATFAIAPRMQKANIRLLCFSRVLEYDAIVCSLLAVLLRSNKILGHLDLSPSKFRELPCICFFVSHSPTISFEFSHKSEYCGP